MTIHENRISRHTVTGPGRSISLIVASKSCRQHHAIFGIQRRHDRPVLPDRNNGSLALDVAKANLRSGMMTASKQPCLQGLFKRAVYQEFGLDRNRSKCRTATASSSSVIEYGAFPSCGIATSVSTSSPDVERPRSVISAATSQTQSHRSVGSVMSMFGSSAIFVLSA